MKTLIAIFSAALLMPSTSAQRRPVTGLWDAVVTVNGVDVPFRMEIAGQGAKVAGWFFNGDEKVTSTRGHLEGDRLVLEFDEYATRLAASWKDDRLEGRYERALLPFYPFRAARFSPAPAPAGAVPSIAGLWNVQIKSSKGESAWRLIVRQSGAEVSAAGLRLDGDTGALTGSYRNGVFTLSHFSGARPSLFDLTPQPDGTLLIVQKALAPPQGPNAKPDPTIQTGR